VNPAAPAPVLLLLDIGPWEFLVLAAAAVMLFGGELPDVMRRAGRFVAKLRGMAEDLGRSASLPEDLAQLPRDESPRGESPRAPSPPPAAGESTERPPPKAPRVDLPGDGTD
jgi:Sec-independent protein translocase protein TatA